MIPVDFTVGNDDRAAGTATWSFEASGETGIVNSETLGAGPISGLPDCPFAFFPAPPDSDPNQTLTADTSVALAPGESKKFRCAFNLLE